MLGVLGNRCQWETAGCSKEERKTAVGEMGKGLGTKVGVGMGVVMRLGRMEMGIWTAKGNELGTEVGVGMGEGLRLGQMERG